MVARKGRDTEIDVLSVDVPLDTTVLWQSLLRNVHARENLQTRHEGRLHVFRDIVLLQTDAVDTVADANAVGHRLDVNIAGPHAIGGVDDQVYQPDDRPVVAVRGRLGPHRLGRQFAAHLGQFGRRRVDTVPETVILFGRNLLFERSVDVRSDLLGTGQIAFELGIQTQSNRIHHVQVHRVADDQLQTTVGNTQRQDAVPTDQILRDDFHRVRGDRDLIQIDVFQAELLGEGLGKGFLVNQLQIEQDLAKPLVVRLAGLDRIDQGLLLDKPRLVEDFP